MRISLFRGFFAAAAGEQTVSNQAGAAERAVSLQNGCHHTHHSGETAHESETFFSGSFVSVSHGARLEASPSRLAADAGGFALDAAAVVLGAVEHDLVLRRFGGRTFCLGA